MSKQRKAVVAVVLVMVLLMVSITLALDYKYVGSRKSNKYHYPTCRWAIKIKPYNLITFESAQEAQATGYVPCKVCRPPLTD